MNTTATAPALRPRTGPLARATRTVTGVLAPVVALVTVAAVVACGSAEDEASPVVAGSGTGATVTVRDAWVKAATTEMTGAFAVLVNSGDTAVTVVSATTTSAATVELHEVAEVDGEMVMRQKAGGFVIPARGEHTLRPGADHLMLMGLTGQIRPGDEVRITLKLSTGTAVEFAAVVKEFAGAQESYHAGEPGASGSR